MTVIQRTRVLILKYIGGDIRDIIQKTQSDVQEIIVYYLDYRFSHYNWYALYYKLYNYTVFKK